MKTKLAIVVCLWACVAGAKGRSMIGPYQGGIAGRSVIGPYQGTNVLWDAGNGFGDPTFVRCAGAVKEGLLTLTNIGRDCEIVFRDRTIDPVDVTGFAFRYRATGTRKSAGQLYYAWEREGYSDLLRWNLPALIADGAWHEVMVDRKALVRPETWVGGGFISIIRFDPLDTDGGKIEFEKIWLVGKEGAPGGGYKGPLGDRPLPGNDGRNAKGESQKANCALDPSWPAVRRVWAEEVGEKVLTHYAPRFSGQMIAAADDTRTGGVWTVSKMVNLRDNPVQAWFQIYGDEQGIGYLNGHKAAVGNQPHRSALSVSFGRVCVLSRVKKGANEIKLSYGATPGRIGAVMAELFVRYGDGACERFVTDASFTDEKGRAAVCYAPPPAAPWAFYPDWVDYDFAQRGLGFAPEADTVMGGGETILRGKFKGKIPTEKMSVEVTLLSDFGTVADYQTLVVTPRDHIVPRADGTWELALPYTAPLYCGGGTYRMRFKMRGLPVIGGVPCESTLKILKVAAIEKYDHPPKVEVKNVENVPELHIDGTPRFLMWGGVTQRNTPDFMPSHGKLPVNVVTVYTALHHSHPKEGVWNFSEYDLQAELYRRANPDAYFMWDLTTYPPRDWAEHHPEEICCDEYGGPSHDSARVNWSFFSKKGLAEVQENVARSIRYLEASPYANRIIGYRINSGHTIEWLGWRPERGKELIFDFSKPAKEYFGEYLAKFYPEIVGAAIPNYKARVALDEGAILWDPAKHLSTIAFVKAHSRVIAEDVLAACGTAKRTLSELGRTKIVGTYYGYTATLNANGVSQMRGHYALKRLLEGNDGPLGDRPLPEGKNWPLGDRPLPGGKKVVDYVMSPQNYGQRNLGDTCGDMKPFSTLQAHGIMPVIEDDTRTHNYNYGDKKGFCQATDARHTREIMRRNMAVYLCRRTPIYLYALVGGRDFQVSEVAQDAHVARLVGEWLVEKKAQRNAEVAVVVSEDTIAASPMSACRAKRLEMSRDYNFTGEPISYEGKGALLEQDLYNDNYSRLTRSGVACDVVLAEDLAQNPGKYKAYIFENCFTADKDFRAAVKKLRARVCSLVWLYAPGFSDGRAQSCANMKDLTGLSFTQLPAAAIPEVTFLDGHKMGIAETKVTPLFALEGAAEKVATYADGSVGVGKVKEGAATTWFSGAWRIDQAFARRVWQDARVHIWTDADDPVEANDRLFTLHARTPGVKHVRLPYRTTVIDVFNGRVMARDAEAFDFTAAMHGSYLFYYGPDAEALLARIKECSNVRMFECSNEKCSNEGERWQVKGDGAITQPYANGVVNTYQSPEKVVPIAGGAHVLDFGKDGFGWFEFDVPANCQGAYIVRLGEKLTAEGRVDQNPGGTIRYAVVTGYVGASGIHRVPLQANVRNTIGIKGASPLIHLPKEQGVVMPFRYVEIEKAPFLPTPQNVRRAFLHWPINMEASSFASSSPELDRVYDFCKYSILATSFAGMYVDGDRERIPYEADAYINQLSHYAIDADYSLARCSHEYLLDNPTWPTEWKQHSIMMAWADWMWSGKIDSLVRNFDRLAKEKLLQELKREDGLLLTGGEQRKGAVRADLGDIVDWPRAERDGFVFRPVNAVVNAFYHLNLNQMADMALALGRTQEAVAYRAEAAQVRASFNRVFWNEKARAYQDGEGTEHASLHANAAALAFDLVPAERITPVADFVEKKGMACSTYFAQYLLEALMKVGRDEAALKLITAQGDRSWLGMMAQGSTITMEAWSLKAKPNQDWNHAWGTPPLNIIARYVLGVTPLEPGFARARIAPQTGSLKYVRGVVPTPRGPIAVEVVDGKVRVQSPVPYELSAAQK